MATATATAVAADIHTTAVDARASETEATPTNTAVVGAAGSTVAAVAAVLYHIAVALAATAVENVTLTLFYTAMQAIDEYTDDEMGESSLVGDSMSVGSCRRVDATCMSVDARAPIPNNSGRPLTKSPENSGPTQSQKT